jgi:WhiB family transcriptional regulator, redox-sensing transcriptional regulator
MWHLLDDDGTTSERSAFPGAAGPTPLPLTRGLFPSDTPSDLPSVFPSGFPAALPTAFSTSFPSAFPSDARTPVAAPTSNVLSLFGTPDDDGPMGWQERALCAQTDPEAFFPEKGGSTREAKKVCSGCDVRAECLDYALANDERFGIWGGLSERERRKLKRRVV